MVIGASLTTKAAPDPVIDLSAVQSHGTFLYDSDGDGTPEIALYSEDFTNIKSELLELGEYVADGKCSVASALYDNGATDRFTSEGLMASTGEIPSFDDIIAGCNSVYQNGYDAGFHDGRPQVVHLSASISIPGRLSSNDSSSITVNADGTARLTATGQALPEDGSCSIYRNGTRVWSTSDSSSFTTTGITFAVSRGDRIYCSAHSNGSWSSSITIDGLIY